MIEILFFTFLIGYVALSAKVFEWQTLTILQFKTSTPQGYIDNSSAYHRACWVFLAGALIVALNSEILPIYLTLPLIAIAWLISGYVGRNNACNRYRAVHAYMIEHSETAEERAEWIAGTKLSNESIFKIVDDMIKWGH
jgi:hypothetical protein